MKTIFVMSEDHTEQYVLIGTAEQILDYMLENPVTIIDTARIINLSGATEVPQEPQEPQQRQEQQATETPRLLAFQKEQAAMVYAYRKMQNPKISQREFAKLIKEKFEIVIHQTEISKIERGKRYFTKKEWVKIETLFSL